MPDGSDKNKSLPFYGGSNIPEINKLLSSFGIQFSDQVFSGDLS